MCIYHNCQIQWQHDLLPASLQDLSCSDCFPCSSIFGLKAAHRLNLFLEDVSTWTVPHITNEKYIVLLKEVKKDTADHSHPFPTDFAVRRSWTFSEMSGAFHSPTKNTHFWAVVAFLKLVPIKFAFKTLCLWGINRTKNIKLKQDIWILNMFLSIDEEQGHIQLPYIKAIEILNHLYILSISF